MASSFSRLLFCVRDGFSRPKSLVNQQDGDHAGQVLQPHLSGFRDGVAVSAELDLLEPARIQQPGAAPAAGAGPRRRLHRRLSDVGLTIPPPPTAHQRRVPLQAGHRRRRAPQAPPVGGTATQRRPRRRSRPTHRLQVRTFHSASNFPKS